MSAPGVDEDGPVSGWWPSADEHAQQTAAVDDIEDEEAADEGSLADSSNGDGLASDPGRALLAATALASAAMETDRVVSEPDRAARGPGEAQLLARRADR